MTQIHVLKKMCQMKKYENIMSEIQIYLLDIVIEVERKCRQMYVLSFFNWGENLSNGNFVPKIN